MAIKTHFQRRQHQRDSLAAEPRAMERYTTSWILPPLALLVIRALFSLYAFTTIFTEIGYYAAHDNDRQNRRSFSYFTVLGYWGLAFYLAFAAAHTASYWVRGKSWLSDWPRALQWLHELLYSTVTVFPLLVTTIFWALLAVGATATPYKTWGNISEHALNSAFALFEILIARTKPLPWKNIPALVILLAAYLALAYITYATENFYVYPFLDPSPNGKRRTGFVAGICIGILAALIAYFTVVHFLIKLRRYITEDRLGMTGKFSSRDAQIQAERRLGEGAEVVELTDDKLASAA